MKILKLKILDSVGTLTSYFVINDDESEIKVVNHVSESSESPFGNKIINQYVLDTYAMEYNDRIKELIEETKERANSVEELSLKNFNYQMKKHSEKQLEIVSVEEPVF